ncbi:MAG: hypothetical protein IJ242_08630 [Clostridia bacterium]|nr:hypothetical protein [Clostridia bacterium]
MLINEILIVPLGPDDGSLLTVGAIEALQQSEKVILRTGRHGAVKMPFFARIAYDTFDALYDSNSDFDELCESAANYLIAQAENRNICYAVPDPAGDATVRILLEKVPETVKVRVLGGVSLADNIRAASAVVGTWTRPEHYHVYFAMTLNERRVQMEPQVICEINDRMLASDVKLWLSDLYDDDTEILFFPNAAEAMPEPRRICLYDLDRQPYYDHRSAVFVPETDVMTRSRAGYEDFVKIIEYLRSPDGCPWDRAQTHKTLRRYMIEEACEAAEAMGTDDDAKIADELGDVLLQVVLNAQIGAEHRSFTDRDITTAITRKMISRHEHVFGTAKAETPEATSAVWEHAKEREHGKQTVYERVADLPETLPVLLKAQKMLKREAQTGVKKMDAFDAGARVKAILEQPDKMTEERLGLCLEALCEIAESCGLDAESSLRERLRGQLEQLKDR